MFKKLDLSDVLLVVSFMVISVRLYVPLYAEYKRERSAHTLLVVSTLIEKKLEADDQFLISAGQPVSQFISDGRVDVKEITANAVAKLNLDGGFEGTIIRLSDTSTHISSLMVKSGEKKIFQLLDEEA